MAKEQKRLEEAEDARRALDLQMELEERRAAAEEKKAEEAQRRAEEERAKHAPSEQAIGQFRQQAKSIIAGLQARYPATFSQRPEYASKLEQQVLGAFISPEDPTDPFAVEKVIGDLEYRLAQIEARINPQGAQKLAYSTDVRGLKHPQSFRTSSAFGKQGVQPKVRARKGAGIAGVLRA